MPRNQSSPMEQLADEARSIELLLDELSPPSDLMEEYWRISLSLIDLVMRIDALAEQPGISMSGLEYRLLRSDLTTLEARITQLERESEVDL